MQTDLAQWTLAQFTAFALMMVRVTVVMMTAPVLGNARIPSQVKVAFSLAISLLLYLALRPAPLPEPGNIFALAAAVAGEAFAGLIVGWFYLKGPKNLRLELKYRLSRWRMERMRKRFNVHQGGRRRDDWHDRVH